MNYSLPKSYFTDIFFQFFFIIIIIKTNCQYGFTWLSLPPPHLSLSSIASAGRLKYIPCLHKAHVDKFLLVGQYWRVHVFFVFFFIYNNGIITYESSLRFYKTFYYYNYLVIECICKLFFKHFLWLFQTAFAGDPSLEPEWQ